MRTMPTQVQAKMTVTRRYELALFTVRVGVPMHVGVLRLLLLLVFKLALDFLGEAPRRDIASGLSVEQQLFSRSFEF